MAKVTVIEQNVLDTYVTQSTADSATNYKLSQLLRAGASGGGAYYYPLIRLANFKSNNRKLLSIKLRITPNVYPAVESNLYIYKVIQDWNEDVTYNTCPMWTGGKMIGTLPASAGATVGASLDYDITDYVTLDELVARGIMLYADISGGHITLNSSRHISGADKAPRLVLIYADAPDLPTDLTPSAGANVEITSGYGRFSWRHNPSTVSGLPQKGYNLQLSSDGITWTTISATSTNQYADVATASIPSGNFYWRVQTIDTDDVPSDYSAQQYAYYGTAPAAPTIITSVFNSSKPRLEWSTAYAQAGYRVQILLGGVSVIDATVETPDAFYDVPVALANATQYTVRVAVKDTSAHYSAWGEDSILTDYAVPGVPTFMLSKKKDSVEITITNALGEHVIRNDIYRLDGGDYVRIGSTAGTVYTDWSVGAGLQSYKVSAVGASGEAMSAAADVNFTLESAYITAVDDPEHPLEVKYNVLDKNSAEHNVMLIEYAGREKPVAEFGEVIQRSIYVTFDSDSPEEYARLNDILKRQGVVLFRNAREKIYGVCTNPTDQPEDYLGMAYNLSFVVNEIEHSEVV